MAVPARIARSVSPNGQVEMALLVRTPWPEK